MSLERRTPLARGKAPRRRARLPKVSAKLADKRKEREAVRVSVYARDGWRCLLWDVVSPLGPCGGEPRTPHHIWKSGRGGQYEAANLVTLCAGHNTAVEDHPRTAWGLGLVVRNGETLSDAYARLDAAGLVPLSRWEQD